MKDNELVDFIKGQLEGAGSAGMDNAMDDWYNGHEYDGAEQVFTDADKARCEELLELVRYEIKIELDPEDPIE